ncbi:putative oxygen-independent coproporphyrinogen III oxidase [Bradyrhizobium sp. GM24.11]
MSRAKEAFGVYVHWPFCLSKCPYCDFNSHVRHAAIDEARFASAFAREIESTAQRSPGREVTSIFLGGGTPSLMQPATVGAVLDSIGKHWRVANDVEVTLEANPTSVEATRFAGYRAAGVNRVSLGVQALDDASLKALGRMHSAREALDAVAIARRSFDRYSFDLIYARPDQTPAMWADELRLAIDEAAEHLSLYQLTIEEGTPFFGLHQAGKLKTPDEAVARALYDVTQETCDKLGLPAYEISNHARRGAECRHNLVYWRGEEYAGIGPGAHGRLDIDGIRHATATEKRPEAWLMRVESSGHGVVTDDLLNSEERADEFLLMGIAPCRRHRPRALQSPLRPPARSQAYRAVARGRRHHRRHQRPLARHEQRIPGAGRRGRGFGGVSLRQIDGALPLPLAGEGWGEGVSAKGQSPRGESPHPALRADLSRKRER